MVKQDEYCREMSQKGRDQSKKVKLNETEPLGEFF